MGCTIPKVINRVYSESNLPTQYQNNVNYLKVKNPNWKHRLYDSVAMLAYVKREFPEIYPYYIRTNPAYGACKADLFRYLLIYNEGGVYFDIKSGAHTPLDDILEADDVYLLSHWPKSEAKIGHHRGISNPNGELQQFHIIATKGHPFLKFVIDTVCNNIKRYNPIIHGAGGSVMVLSGPITYTNIITPLLDKYPCRLSYNHEQLGIYYSCLNDLYLHRRVNNKKHYSELTIPIVKQSFLINLIFSMVYKIKKLILK